jgi:uncharacterized protein
VCVICLPKLRRSLNWFRRGRFSVPTLTATIGLAIATALVLTTFHAATKPELSAFRAAFPFGDWSGMILAGIIFCTVNATLEEMVFRGILFDSIESQWGVRLTVIATSLLFGLGHLRGYPPGAIGVVLAAMFGICLGVLRLWTRGLAAPIFAHIVADATIYCLVFRTGEK